MSVSDTAGARRHGALIQDSQEEIKEVPLSGQVWNVLARKSFNLTTLLSVARICLLVSFPPQAEHQRGGRLRQDGLDERHGHAPSLAALPPGDHSLGAVRQDGSKPGSADSLPGDAADPQRRSACAHSPTRHQSFVYVCVTWGGFTTVLWVNCTVDHRHRGVCSSLITMPTLDAFKQTSRPEREPEASLTRLCQGSYLKLQKCIFRSAQRMVDPGGSGDQ